MQATETTRYVDRPNTSLDHPRRAETANIRGRRRFLPNQRMPANGADTIPMPILWGRHRQDGHRRMSNGPLRRKARASPHPHLALRRWCQCTWQTKALQFERTQRSAKGARSLLSRDTVGEGGGVLVSESCMHAQPVPELNFALEAKSALSHPAQRKVPARFSTYSGDVFGDSVPPSRRTKYCISDSAPFHSAVDRRNP